MFFSEYADRKFEHADRVHNEVETRILLFEWQSLHWSMFDNTATLHDLHVFVHLDLRKCFGANVIVL